MSEKVRDVELRDIKIESLENIIKKRDMQQSENQSHIVKILEDKIQGLESDRQKLISDNLALIKQIERLREEIGWQQSQDTHGVKTLEDRCRNLQWQLDQVRREKLQYQVTPIQQQQQHIVMDEQNKENSSILYNNSNSMHQH